MFPGNGLCASFEDVFLQTNTLRLILNRQYLFLYQGYSAMFSQQPRDIRIYLSTGKVPVNLRNTTSFRTLSVPAPVSYTHLRAHETRHDLVCRLLLEKKT